MSPDNNSPATKADLKALEEKLIETMRDMQTELLRGFAAHNTGLTVRMRKVEADQSNLDAPHHHA
ncbi:MAG: hypothetical protein JOY62_18415 [Acidobacteriaceae bacterium]|nr:hypothetical protein [Acidobacteriaceae bacterium]MBV9781941.1 hypothetical protein [Acidobacteriaceae bacterium]